jgi:hypothetical protein
MKKSLAKLKFTEIIRPPAFVKKGNEWRTPTTCFKDCNWTIRSIFLEDLQEDNSVLVEISCFPEGEELIHIAGNKLPLFTGNPKNLPFKCECEVIRTF